MLDRLAADARGIWHSLQALFHRFEHRFVLPARYAPVLAVCALRLDRTSRTRRRPVLMDDLIVLDGREAPDRTLTGRAWVLIAPRVISEVALIELALGQVAGGMGLGHQDIDPGLFALEDLGAGVIASIGQCGELVGSRTSAFGAYDLAIRFSNGAAYALSPSCTVSTRTRESAVAGSAISWATPGNGRNTHRFA
jgi:hypothetical protein